MKVEILRGTVVDGSVWEPGDVVDTDDRTAQFLISKGKAKEILEVTVSETEEGTEQDDAAKSDGEISDPTIPEISDVAPVKKAKATKAK